MTAADAVVTDAVRWACSNSLSGEKFDAWLAAHDREVQAQAWDEGYTHCFDVTPDAGDVRSLADNPYRAARLTAETKRATACPRCCPEPCCDHRAMEYGNCTDCMNTRHHHARCPDHEEAAG